MSERIAFHLDEHIPTAIADGLRRRGIHVSTSVESGLVAESDEYQLAYAEKTGRVLVTHDPDFVAFHRAGMPHAGVVFCQQRNRSIGELLRGLILIWEVLTAEEMKNHLEFL